MNSTDSSGRGSRRESAQDGATDDEALRYRAAETALDTSSRAVLMARLVASVRAPDCEAPGRVIVGGARLRNERRVGLLAASMNPLTRAHLALAASARVAARLDALCWVATAVTIDKESVERATLADRLLQAQAHARVAGDGLLLLRGGLYVEQARAARALLTAPTEVTLIVGFDKIVQIFDPRYYANRDAALRDLFAEAEVVVAPRAGSGESELRALLERPENRPYAARVRFCPLPPRFQRDSSTEARQAAASDQQDALHTLLAPEGRALALTTRAYDPIRAPGPSDLGDAYSARQALIAARSGLPAVELAQVPTLGRLVALAGEPVAGAALRVWVAEPSRHTLAGLYEAMEAR